MFDHVDLTLNDVGVSDNETLEEGGGLHGTCGNVTIADSVIENNSSYTASAGGVFMDADGCTGLAAGISNTRVADNGALSSCGGILFQDIGVTITGSTIQSNSAGKGVGGGLCVGGQPVQINTSAILDNSSGVEGGGIYLTGISGSSRIENTTIAGNSAGGYLWGGGGAIYDNVAAGACLCDHRR